MEENIHCREFEVLNLPVHLLDDYTSWLRLRLERKLGTHVVTLNAEMAMLSEKNQELADVIKTADLVIPDGSGVILYLWLRSQRQKRCPGIDLATSILEQIAVKENSYLICFYGGKPQVNALAVQFWQEKRPNLCIIYNHGYLSPEEERKWCNIIKAKQPRLILVGLGVPRQELWIRDHRHLAPEATWMGIGGSFDVWAGVKSRAPQWLIQSYLEWLYRLYQEPWRWRRMLALPQFAWRALDIWH